MYSFKIWSADRSKRKVIVLQGDDNLFDRFMESANKKLRFSSETAVLEEDGTEVDDTESLKLYNKGTFLFLQNGEIWEKAKESPPERIPLGNVSNNGNLKKKFFNNCNKFL